MVVRWPRSLSRVDDGGGAEPVLGIEVEDQPDDGGFVVVDLECVVGFVDEVAEGAASAFPESFGGFAFHTGDDAVDDGVAFELREHAEHLDEHAAHRCGGVEGFGG